VNVISGQKESSTKELEGIRLALSNFFVLNFNSLNETKILSLKSKFSYLS